MNNLSLPIGFDRLNSFPLDASSVFNTYSQLSGYAATGAAAYQGQLCYSKDTDKIYVLSTGTSAGFIAKDIGSSIGGSAGSNLITGGFSVKSVSIGSYNDGDPVQVGESFEDVIKKMLQKEVCAPYSYPTVSITSNLSSSYEIGTSISPVITGSFSKNEGGSITQYVLKIDGSTNVQTISNPTSPSSYTSPSSIILGSDDITYQATISYDAGSPKNSNLGKPCPNPVPAGTKDSNIIRVSSKRAVFYVADSSTAIPANPGNVTNLIKTLDVTDGSTFVINVSTNAKRIVIAYPKAYGTLVRVIDSGTGYEVKAAFGTPQEMNIGGASPGFEVPYYVYTSVLSASYSSAVTYTVTI
jgi:hypothetical protein